jgi:hypothetical protein
MKIATAEIEAERANSQSHEELEFRDTHEQSGHATAV